MGVRLAQSSIDGANATFFGLRDAHVGRRFILGVVDRAGGTSATAQLDGAAMSLVHKEVTLPDDGTHRRSAYLFETIIGSTNNNQIVSTTVLNSSMTSVAKSWIAIVIDESDGYELVGFSSGHSGSSTTSSQSTGSTDNASGSVLMVTLATMKGDTTATWDITTNSPPNPEDVNWNLNVLSGSGATARRGTMGYAVLPAQSSAPRSDTVTLGTARTASALIAVWATNGGAVPSSSSDSASVYIEDEASVFSTEGAELDDFLDVGTVESAARVELVDWQDSNLNAIPHPTSVDLSWDAHPGAIEYDVERDGAVIQSGVLTTSFTDTGLEFETGYVYRVAAVLDDDPERVVEWSAHVYATTPFSAVPVGLIAEVVSESEIDLTWDPYPGASGYDVERDGNVIAEGVETSYFVDSDLEPETQYEYRIRAVVNEPDIVVPNSWEDAVASQSFEIVEAWYAENTGFRAAGYEEEDLVSGSLVSAFDGQVIEGVRGGPIRIAHNNVTIRGCLVDNWGTYGAYFNPTFGSTVTGSVIENCTFIGPGGNPEQQRRGAYFTSGVANAITIRYCDFFGWTSGAASDRGMTVEYSWIHDLASPEASEAHRTSLRTSGSYVTFRRNYCTDGGSSCISVYADVNPLIDVLVEENILNGSSPNASPSYLIHTKSGTNGPTATNVRYLGNMLGPIYQFGVLTGGNIAWGSADNERTGNKMFLTNEPVGNSS